MILNASSYELEETPWADRAACRGARPDLWFPERGASPADAKTVCATCPVRPECLDYALRWDIGHGIWGGLSARERRRLPRRRSPRRLASAHGTTGRYARGCRCEGCTEANSFATLLRVEQAAVR